MVKRGESDSTFKYLRAIFTKGGYPGGNYVRISQISRELGLSVPTVSIMVRRLESKGLVYVEKGLGAMLTEKGIRVLAESCWKKTLVESLLREAGVPLNEASKVAEIAGKLLSDASVVKIWGCTGKPLGCLGELEIVKNDVKKLISWLRDCCGLKESLSLSVQGA